MRMNLLFILLTTRLYTFGWPVSGNHGWTGWLIMMKRVGFIYTGKEMDFLDKLYHHWSKGKCRCFVGGHAITGIVTCDSCGGWIDFDEYDKELKKAHSRLK